MRHSSLVSCKVSVDRADLGMRHLLVSLGTLSLSRFGQFRRVAFTNTFTDRSADLRLLHLSRPPRSCRPLTRDAADKAIMDAIDRHVKAEQDSDDEDGGAAGMLVPAG